MWLHLWYFRSRKKGEAEGTASRARNYEEDATATTNDLVASHNVEPFH
jgi:hypothetical protein